MKFTLTLFFFFNITLFSYSQDLIFSNLQEMPIGRSAINSATDGNSIYIVNGFTTTLPYSSDLIKYDLSSDSWSVISNNTIPKRYPSIVFLDGKLYIFNGNLEGGLINSNVEVIDLSDNSITLTTEHPNPGRAGDGAVWDGKIYSFGGATLTGYSDKLFSFDPTTAIWTPLADMPEGREVKGEIVNGKLYLFGGYNGTALNRIDRYDIATDSWEMIGTMPSSISANATTMIGSKIWLIGDFANLESLAYFDTEDDSFHIVTSNMEPRRHAAAEGIGEKLYIIGGNTASNIATSLSNIQVADIISSNEEVLLEEMKIYPNPVSEILFFEKEISQIQIHDANGKLVKSFSERKEKINISDLATGSYILIGDSDGKQLRANFVKIED